jgi:hypothetical protein
VGVLSLFFVARLYCTDPCSLYNKERARFFRLSFGTIIEASLEVFLLLLGRTVQVVQHSVGHIFLGTNFKEAVQMYGFGHDFQGRKLWGQICCCEVFFLAGNCECAAVMYFPEAI